MYCEPVPPFASLPAVGPRAIVKPTQLPDLDAPASPNPRDDPFVHIVPAGVQHQLARFKDAGKGVADDLCAKMLEAVGAGAERLSALDLPHALQAYEHGDEGKVRLPPDVKEAVGRVHAAGGDRRSASRSRVGGPQDKVRGLRREVRAALKPEDDHDARLTAAHGETWRLILSSAAATEELKGELRVCEERLAAASGANVKVHTSYSDGKDGLAILEMPLDVLEGEILHAAGSPIADLACKELRARCQLDADHQSHRDRQRLSRARGRSPRPPHARAGVAGARPPFAASDRAGGARRRREPGGPRRPRGGGGGVRGRGAAHRGREGVQRPRPGDQAARRRDAAHRQGAGDRAPRRERRQRPRRGLPRAHPRPRLPAGGRADRRPPREAPLPVRRRARAGGAVRRHVDRAARRDREGERGVHAGAHLRGDVERPPGVLQEPQQGGGDVRQAGVAGGRGRRILQSAVARPPPSTTRWATCRRAPRRARGPPGADRVGARARGARRKDAAAAAAEAAAPLPPPSSRRRRRSRRSTSRRRGAPPAARRRTRAASWWRWDSRESRRRALRARRRLDGRRAHPPPLRRGAAAGAAGRRHAGAARGGPLEHVVADDRDAAKPV